MKPLTLLQLALLASLTACAHQEVKMVKVTEYKAVVIPKSLTTVKPAPQPPPQELYIKGKDLSKATVKEREAYLSDYITELLKDRRGLETQFLLIDDYQTKMVKKIEEQNHASKSD